MFGCAHLLKPAIAQSCCLLPNHPFRCWLCCKRTHTSSTVPGPTPSSPCLRPRVQRFGWGGFPFLSEPLLEMNPIKDTRSRGVVEDDNRTKSFGILGGLLSSEQKRLP